MPEAKTWMRSKPSEPWKFTVGVRLQQNGPPLIHESVSELDLIDALGETWLECMLRRGHWDAALEDLDVRLEPIFSKEGATCTGYAIKLADANGRRGRREFTIRSLDEVASRGAQRLLDRGKMQEDDVYYFNLFAERVARAVSEPTGKARLFSGEVRTRPLEPLEVPLGPLLDQARTVGPHDADIVHAFYTEAALARAESFSRKGAQSNPPTETGGVLIGPLCRADLRAGR